MKKPYKHKGTKWYKDCVDSETMIEVDEEFEQSIDEIDEELAMDERSFIIVNDPDYDPVNSGSVLFMSFIVLLVASLL